MLIAQLSDLHITRPGTLAYDRVDTAGFLARAVAHLAAQDPRPDVVVVSGDLVDKGTAEEYALVRHLLAPLALPVYVVPGNHDDRDTMRAAFADTGVLPAEGELNYVVEADGLRLVMLDTLDPGKTSGLMGPRRLAWLDATLAAAPAQPTLVVMHHPLLHSGIAHMDRINEADAQAFAAVVRRHPQIERIACGHVHRTLFSSVGGAPTVVAPSTAHQLTLALDPEDPGGAVMEPPGYLLHWWRPGAALVTHVVPVGDFGPATPFGPRKPRPTPAR